MKYCCLCYGHGGDNDEPCPECGLLSRDMCTCGHHRTEHVSGSPRNKRHTFCLKCTCNGFARPSRLSELGAE